MWPKRDLRKLNLLVFRKITNIVRHSLCEQKPVVFKKPEFSLILYLDAPSTYFGTKIRLLFELAVLFLHYFSDTRFSFAHNKSSENPYVAKTRRNPWLPLR